MNLIIQNKYKKINNVYNDFKWNVNNTNLKIKTDSNKFLMKQFIDSCQNKKWPTSTNIYCFWCCHSFPTIPCALPIKYNNNTFTVYGCFCSPECAAAYNFNDFQDTENRWERYSLLNMLYTREKHTQIKLAPPRQILDIFGGTLSILQFRENLTNYKEFYNLNFPPMISILVQQEKINLDNIKKDNPSLFIPIDENRVTEADQNLKLKRSKSVSTKNTLEILYESRIS